MATSAPWSLNRCKDAYEAFLNAKVAEINEQKTNRRYYHGAQLTAAQEKAIRARNMAPVKFNRIKPKIDELMGTLERLKQDPKAYPRTEQHRQGADLATQTIQFELEESDFDYIKIDVAKNVAIDAIGGVELNLQQSERAEGDYDIDLVKFDPEDFFYDPRTFKRDFSDSRYMGVGKWFTLDDAVQLYPDKMEELQSSASGDETDHTSYPERDQKWFVTDERADVQKVRIVEVWYRVGPNWRWAIFTGSTVLYEGESPLFDERGKQICKYIAFAADRDHDGDAYNWIRNMKYAQDEINAWKMGLNYDILSRRLILIGEDEQNIEQIRSEYARKDGLVTLQNPAAQVVKDDKRLDIEGAMHALADSKAEMNQYGFDYGIIPENHQLSGRAIELLGKAGLSRLGPFMVEFKHWKLRVYRAVWSAIQRYWKAERWVRVTDDEDVAQFIQVNQLAFMQDPMTGATQAVMQNALGSLDVDIVIDEGPDYVNQMQETAETLSLAMRSGQNVPFEITLDVLNVDAKTKKRWREILERERQRALEPDPIQEMAAQTQIELGRAQIEAHKARAARDLVEAQAKRPTPLDDAEQVASIQKTQADTEKALNEAGQTNAGPLPNVPTALDEAEQIARIRKTDADRAAQLASIGRSQAA